MGRTERKQLEPYDDPFDDHRAIRSWPKAYGHFLIDRHESLALKIAPLAVLGYAPIAVLNDIIPGIGLIDDVPTAIVGAVVGWLTMKRVENHR